MEEKSLVVYNDILANSLIDNDFRNICYDCYAKKCVCTYYRETFNNPPPSIFDTNKKQNFYKNFGDNPPTNVDINLINQVFPDLVSRLILDYCDYFNHLDIISQWFDPYYNSICRYYVKPKNIPRESISQIHKNLDQIYRDYKEDLLSHDYSFDAEEKKTNKENVVFHKIYYDFYNQYQPAGRRFKDDSFKRNLAEFVHHHKFCTFSDSELSEWNKYIVDLRMIKLKVYARSWNILRFMSGGFGGVGPYFS